MTTRIVPSRVIASRRTLPGTSDLCTHGTASALANMAQGSTVIICRPVDVASGDRSIWTRVNSGSVFSSTRFAVTTFRRRIQRATTALDLQVLLKDLPGFALDKWVVLAATWDTTKLANNRVYSATLGGRLEEAFAYSARTLGSGAMNNDSAIPFRTWSRGGVNEAFDGHGHSIFVQNGPVMDLMDLQDIASAMWEGDHRIDGLATGLWYAGLNEGGEVYDWSGNGNHGTWTGSAAGLAPPLRVTRHHITAIRPAAGGAASPAGGYYYRRRRSEFT